MSDAKLEVSQTLSVSVPKQQEGHMVYGHELSEMERCRTQTANSVGYACLGAALGGAVPFVQAVSKISGRTPLDWSDAAAITVFLGALFVGLTCLLFRYQSDDTFGRIVASVRNRTGVAAARRGNGSSAEAPH
jgi:hypothetical protein